MKHFKETLIFDGYSLNKIFILIQSKFSYKYFNIIFVRFTVCLSMLKVLSYISSVGRDFSVCYKTKLHY